MDILLSDCSFYNHGCLEARSRINPLTGEKLNRPVSLARIVYAQCHEITLDDLDGYQVRPEITLCGTPGCMNPLHWKVTRQNSKSDIPIIPWWLDD